MSLLISDAPLEQTSAVAIWWIRRDLRLADNMALTAALAYARRVVPVFVLDPMLLRSPYTGPKRIAFLFDGLRALDRDLRARGSRLIVRRGPPGEELARLAAETGASAIFAEEDYSDYARQRDEAVLAGLPLQLTSRTIRPPEALLKRDGTPYRVFTPFSRAWLAQPLPGEHDLLPAPDRLLDPGEVIGEAIPSHPGLPGGVSFVPGEVEAKSRLARFAAGGINAYGGARNRLDLDGTSRLSPYLRWGMISARTAVVAALRAQRTARDPAARKGAEAWLNELIWREFYIYILAQFPHVLSGSFQDSMRHIAWQNDLSDFEAWCQGRTGYPVVDAAMRQLQSSGWMHNRARMIVASFLVKDLLIDWRWGERWFMQHLIDGDPAANNGGWQWTAGTGTDAAPYFRVFNPITQGRTFDPAGHYVRGWLPELAGVPDAQVYEPWRMSADEQRAAGCILGRDYPYPIVDHAWARARALATYQAARAGRIA